MARSQSNGALKFVGAAAVAIIGGVAIGYLVGGAHTPHTGDLVAPTPMPIVSTPAPPATPPVAHPQPSNGNYTAPGAPRIAIREESAPALRHVSQPTPDPEASQEAAPKSIATDTPSSASPSTPAPSSETAVQAVPADTLPLVPPDQSSNTTAPAPDKTNSGNSPPAPADPDFERVGKPADTESSQQGTDNAQFRVQTGSYTDESNARSIADELRGKGYSASTRSEREGDHLIYKVQVGAYRTKAGASKAADDLQKKGYSAYISPISP